MSQPTRALYRLQCATRYSWCRIKERFKPVRLNISTIYIIFFSPTASDLYLVSPSVLTKIYLQQILYYSRQLVLATHYDCATVQETMAAKERIQGVNVATLQLSAMLTPPDMQAAATRAQDARTNRGMRRAFNAAVASATAGVSGQQSA